MCGGEGGPPPPPATTAAPPGGGGGGATPPPAGGSGTCTGAGTNARCEGKAFDTIMNLASSNSSFVDCYQCKKTAGTLCKLENVEASLCGSSGGGTTPPPSGSACPGLGGLGQTCRVPQNCNNLPNCDGGLSCIGGKCIQATGNQCGSSGRCRVHICDKCSNYGGSLDECRSAGTEVPCSSASVPSGQCGQVDILKGDGSYCGVKQQACTGSCAGGTAPPPPGNTPTPTTPPAGPQCTKIKVYKDGVVLTATQLTALTAGDKIKVGIQGARDTKARYRINSSAWVEIASKNNNLEYISGEYTIPADKTTFTVEAEVFGDGVWK